MTFKVLCGDGKLPKKYAEEGNSPAVEWQNVPEGTKSLALVVQDADPPDGEPQESDDPPPSTTYWVVVNIPPTLTGLPEGFSGKAAELAGDYAKIKEGHNDEKVPGWSIPKSIADGHRFDFGIIALKEELNLGNEFTKEKLLEVGEDLVLDEANLEVTLA